MGHQIINEFRENYSIITLHGNKEIYIENFISIIELTLETAKIKAQKEIIAINGDKLIIEYLSKDDLKISGHINTIELTEVE